MSFFKNKENLLVLCIIALVLFFTWGKDRSAVAPQTLAELPAQDATEQTEAVLYVHITGRVHSPGVVRMDTGARLQDAVEAAGGLYPDADTTQINLSMKLKDEDKIHIPAQGELPAAAGAANSGLVEDGLIDINHAGANELETLPGIGPALAQRIIEYREGSPFSAIEDIQNVRGIGEKLFEGMKEQITVR